MIFLTGGARSGKSDAAARILGGDDNVVYIATGQRSDDEMAARIEAHQRQRSHAWRLIEEPIDLEGALKSVDEGSPIIIDCLTLWLANLLEETEDDQILSLSRGDVSSSLAAGAQILFATFVIVSCATIFIALVDVPFQLWQHNKQMRMSRQQLKDEMKETDGSPELKARVRSLQQEIARRRMMEDVPKADVVVTNPEHFAVALKFDVDTMRAPIVVGRLARKSYLLLS